MAGNSDASDSPVPPDYCGDHTVMNGFFQSGTPRPEDRYISVAETERHERLIRIMNGAAGLVLPLLVMVYVIVLVAILFFRRSV
jgi:hypothetical protein